MRAPPPKWYGVTSPEYQMYGESGLSRDWLPVQTTSARRARLLAVRAWKRRRSKWWRYREPTENPYARVIAHPLAPCEHGNVFDCTECEEDWAYLADAGALA